MVTKPFVGMNVELKASWNPNQAPVGSIGVVRLIRDNGGFEVDWVDPVVHRYAGDEHFWFGSGDFHQYFKIGDGPW